MVERLPRVSVGLPVYNGDRFLREAVESLLAQTYEDFELVISDNASTDGTEAICREVASRDPRVRYYRSPVNHGMAWNHNRVVHLARGEYFKWSAHDDRYAPDLLRRCVEVLDAEPDVVLCHALVADIDIEGRVVHQHEYTLNTGSPSPSERLHELLVKEGGHDVYGLMRLDVLRRTNLHGSYHRYAERVFVSEVGLYGRFHQVPEVLYYHREYPGSAQRKYPTFMSAAPVLDPRRANRLLHPKWRLGAEYVIEFVRAIGRAPLPAGELARCYAHLAAWLGGNVARRIPGRYRRREQELSVTPSAQAPTPPAAP